MAFCGQPTPLEFHPPSPQLCPPNLNQGSTTIYISIRVENATDGDRMNVDVSSSEGSGFSGCLGKKAFGAIISLSQIRSQRAGSQPRLRLGGTTIITTIRKQTAPAEVFCPGKN